MKHNGIEYVATPHGDVVDYDGGAMGGKFKCYPSGMYFGNGVWHRRREDAADLAQLLARKRYKESCKFVFKFVREYKKLVRSVE